jgi:hypothetical protein
MDFALILETFLPFARERVEREASKRGCSAPELLAKLADRLKDERRRRKLIRLFDKVLVRYRAEKDASDLLRHLNELDWITVNLMLMSQSERKRGFRTLWGEAHEGSDGQN